MPNAEGTLRSRDSGRLEDTPLIEFCLLIVPPVGTFHRLLILSDLLNIALWTKPPMPFVGKPERCTESPLRWLDICSVSASKFAASGAAERVEELANDLSSRAP